MHRSLVLNLNWLLFIMNDFRSSEETLIIRAAPEKVLDKVRERQVHDAFEQIVNQLFSLGAIGATPQFQALYNSLNFIL